MTTGDRESQPEGAPGWVAFEISSDLRQRAEAVVENIRSDTDKRRHAPALAEVVVAMTDRGLYYYFLHPLEEAKVGVVTRKAVDLALGTAGRTLPMVVKKTVNSLNDEQISSIAEFLDHILLSGEEESLNP